MRQALVMPIALVTGVGREEGLGSQVARQLRALGWTVHALSRHELDVSSDADVLRVARGIGPLDALVNNASGAFDADTPTREVTIEAAKRALDVDLFGAWRTMLAFAPALEASERGAIVNVSSGAGSFADPKGLTNLDVEWAASLVSYSVAKAALNALTLKMAAAYSSLRVNAVNPGYVAADPARAARGVVWAATLPADGPTGGFFFEGCAIPW